MVIYGQGGEKGTLFEAEVDKKRYEEEVKAYQESTEIQAFMKRTQLQSLIDWEGEAAVRQRTPCQRQQLCRSRTKQEEEEEDPLYCPVCHLRFTSGHNRREHALGRQHLATITSDFEAESRAVDRRRPLADAAAEPPSPPSAEEHARAIRELARGQALEARELRLNVERLRHVKTWRLEEARAAREDEARLEREVEVARGHGATLRAQLDALRMVPTLFGVINF
ncbi:PREDICTED: uncharacterized protein LOC106810905 [Priapulus caudatus]|uniref:Uncharacterized protein LOC106810905 n=1 Tax=Priapulus caudatus TaxID=37621 RepID=A0ABM1ECE1_PRICU|nr:PREDICTED: uncharacterized protein LOC106810905 [Priapulus caudatus]